MNNKMNKSRHHWHSELKQAAIALPIIVAVVVLWHFETVFGCAIGGIFVLIGSLMIGQTLWMSRSGQFAQATVVEHELDEDCYFPVVEFRDRIGNTRRERTDFGRGTRSPSVGSRVLVMYDPNGTLECQIINVARWVVPLALIAVGVAICSVVLTAR
jgi:uncharacterized membrane protein YgcG